MSRDYMMGERTRRVPRRTKTRDDYGGGLMARRKKKGGLLLGLLVGAGIGLLFAPKAGRELREQLFGGSLDEQKSRWQDAVGAGRESAEKRAETLRAKIDETRQRLREQMGDSA
jgi:gas vesicle protein